MFLLVTRRHPAQLPWGVRARGALWAEGPARGGGARGATRRAARGARCARAASASGAAHARCRWGATAPRMTSCSVMILRLVNLN